MEEKEKKLIITFHTTTDVMFLEKTFKKLSSEYIGEIVSLPSKISEGCGIAWSSPLSKKENVLSLLKDNNLRYDKIYEIEI